MRHYPLDVFHIKITIKKLTIKFIKTAWNTTELKLYEFINKKPILDP
jgi:hypothetical protein